MKTNRKIGVVALAGVAIVMFAPAQPAAADSWCTNIKVNGRSLLGEPTCQKIAEIIGDLPPGYGQAPN